MDRFYHGSPKKLQIGDYLLPSSITGIKTHNQGFDDYVYIADIETAETWSRPTGYLYEVEFDEKDVFTKQKNKIYLKEETILVKKAKIIKIIQESK